MKDRVFVVISRPTAERRSVLGRFGLGLVLATALPLGLGASPGGEAFNTSTGRLNVDYAGYMSKQDVVYNLPETNPIQGLTVGNGRVGAMVWSANGLTMQISGVDASEQGAFSEGLVNLYTSPGMDTGYTNFQQRLSLYNGTLTTTYDTNRTVTIMGEAGSEVMGIHVNDTRAGVTAVTLDLSLWDVSGLGDSGNVGGSNLTSWKTVSTYADSTGVGLSRGQADSYNFGYTLAATVDGAAFTSQSVSPNLVRLNITPSGSYTIWIACASRLNAPSHNSVAQARSLLSAVTGTYSSTLAAYQAWWNAFWSKSFVGYSNNAADADYLENLYYLATYMIAAGGYGNYPFHFINGVFRATGDSTKWSNAYWYWNQRDVYNSFLASNHPDMMQVFNNMYARNSSYLTTQTNGRYKLSGIWVPETMGWDGDDSGTIGSTYTDNIYSSGTEAAENMYRQYAYTNNYAYLTSTAYPFMKQVATFYTNILATNAGGQYYIPKTVDGSFGDNAHETYWNIQDALTDLAAIRSLFPDTIKAAQLQGVDAAFVTQLQNILNKLVPYPVDPGNSGQYYPCDAPLPSSSNNENITCELAWPYSVLGIGTSDLSMGISNWNNRPFPYGNVWSPDAIQAARLGLGPQTFAGMKTMMQIYQSYPNGMTNNSNGVFEYLGVNLSAMNEGLLQSYNDKIRVFPALPSDSTLAARYTLAAKGGFLVSSECENGAIKYVGIDSLYGNPATVESPWSGQQTQVRRVSDNAILASGTGAEFSFATAANTVYVLELAAAPLGSYGYEQISAGQNQDGKVMGGNVLGVFLGTPSSSGKYEGENSTLGGTASVSGDSAASGAKEVVNLSQGASLTFTNVIAGTGLQIQYCTQNNPGKLDLYINGVLSQAISFPSNGVWSGSYASVAVTVAIPAGATVKLQYDAGDAGANIDFIQIISGATATPTRTPTVTPTPTQVVKATWRINAGGPQYTDGSGNVWSADGNFDMGASSSTTTAISGTSDPALYQTTHWNSAFTYSFAVPAGSYQVTLKFAENYYTTTGQRIQNVGINGTQVLSNFDIVSDAGGADKADDKVFNNIAPAGGMISIQFSGATGSPDGHALVSALQVIPQASTATPTWSPTATSTSTTPSPTSTLGAGSPTPTPAPGSIRVACVGASITWGYCASNPATASYPSVMQGLLGAGYLVQNDGYSGAGILKLGQEPYWGSTQMANALAFNPNIVIIDLGANDTKPICWQYNANLEADFTAMINQFKALPSHPTVYLALPCWVYTPNYGITENIVAEYLLPRMIKVANQQGVCMIDMFDALYNQPGYYCTDGVHLNDTGYAYMAQVMANAITGKTACYQAPATTPTPTPTVTLGASSQNWRINAGGPAYTDGSGNVWSADGCYVGGAANSTAAGISGTTDPALYQNERQGDVITYAFPVPAWDYKVTVKLAEIDGNTTGQRLQNVYINGNQVLANFDVYAQAGADKAYDAVYDYVAPNAIGQIFVQLGVTGAGASSICAVQVAPEVATPTITPTYTATPTASPVPTPGSCPQADAFGGSSLQGFWSQADIGGASGSSTALSGGLNVTTSSGDIGGNADSFHYVFQAASQNIDVRLKVNSTAANWNAKSGIMLRDSTGGGAADFYIAGTYSCCNYESGYRTFIGGNDNAVGAGTYTSGANPGYVRVARSGSTFTSYWSSDNSTWNQVQSVTLAMQPNYLVGICTSIGNGGAGTASYGNFTVTCSGPVATATPGLTATPSGTITPSPSRTATFSPSATSSPPPTATPTALVQATWRVNSGGPAYTDTLGHVWSADQNYSGGTVNGTANAISGTADPALYQDERWGVYNYTFNVPPGNYQVTMKFAELYWTAAGDRVFNVSINDATVLTNWDIFSEVGQYHADDKVFDNIAPSGGQIVVQLGPASHDNPTLDAIQIIPEPATPTPSPSSTLSPSRTVSPSPTRTNPPANTPLPTATPSGTVSPAPTKTGTTTNTALPTVTPSWTASPLATKTSTPANTAVATATPSWTASTVATKTSTPTNTAVATSTPSWTASPIATKTSTPTITPLATVTLSWTASPLATKTSTPTNSAVATATLSWTASPLATKTGTPTNTSVATATPSWTASPLATKTGTPTITSLATATLSWTASPLATKTSTPTNTGVATATPSPTASPLATMTSTPSSTVPATATPSGTVTVPPTLSGTPTPAVASATPTPTARPLSSRTPTAGTPGVVLGPPLIDKAYGVPNPNPTAISFHLQGAVDNVSVQLYSRAMVLFWGGSSGSEAAGWDRFNLPASALAGAGNGVCYAVLTPLRNGSAGKRVVLSLMVLR